MCSPIPDSSLMWKLNWCPNPTRPATFSGTTCATTFLADPKSGEAWWRVRARLSAQTSLANTRFTPTIGSTKYGSSSCPTLLRTQIPGRARRNVIPANWRCSSLPRSSLHPPRQPESESETPLILYSPKGSAKRTRPKFAAEFTTPPTCPTFLAHIHENPTYPRVPDSKFLMPTASYPVSTPCRPTSPPSSNSSTPSRRASRLSARCATVDFPPASTRAA